MNTSLDLTISIACWNNGQLLGQCLDSIFRHTSGILYEAIVVDNNSTDDSCEMLRNNFPQVKLIRNADNQGFAKAHNKALSHARGRYAVILNQDTVILDNAFLKMVKFMDLHSEVGALGCKVYTSLAKDRIQETAFKRFPTPFKDFLKTLEISNIKLVSGSKTIKRLARKFSLGAIDYNLPQEVGHLVGAVILIRKEVLETAGFLDERFFMYYEETDWCLRMRRCGWKIYYFPEAEIAHFYDPKKSSQGIQKLIRRQSYLKYLTKHHSILSVMFFKLLFTILNSKDRLQSLNYAYASR
jgi:GT2 family glycosyltransferase